MIKMKNHFFGVIVMLLLNTAFICFNIIYAAKGELHQNINASISQSNSNNFYNNTDKYRGFYWFEKNALKKEQSKQEESVKPTFDSLTPAAAKEIIERRKQELEDSKNIMIALITEGAAKEDIRKAIAANKRKEKELFNWAGIIQNQADLVNFLNPEIADLANNPINSLAGKMKREVKYQEYIRITEKFSKLYDLILFTKDDCIYSKKFTKIARDFCNISNINLEYLKIEEKPQLFSQFNIKVTPTLVAISKDGKNIFELSRGVISRNALKHQIYLSMQYYHKLSTNKI